MTQFAPIDAEHYRTAPVRATRAPASRARQSGRRTATHAEHEGAAGEERLGAYGYAVQEWSHDA